MENKKSPTKYLVSEIIIAIVSVLTLFVATFEEWYVGTATGFILFLIFLCLAFCAVGSGLIISIMDYKSHHNASSLVFLVVHAMLMLGVIVVIILYFLPV
ncbi:MAG: hypothetical protein MJ206_02575 [Bacilli bacterium]|nr:hypothetical protein [Bacilli bacterium]